MPEAQLGNFDIRLTRTLTLRQILSGEVPLVDAYQEQVEAWLFRPARLLAQSTANDLDGAFALFALELMFFEPHAQLLHGRETPARQSGNYFQFAFQRLRDHTIKIGKLEETARQMPCKIVWTSARNGLFHNTVLGAGLMVDALHMKPQSFYRAPIGQGWLVNPWQLLEDLEVYLDSYVTAVRNRPNETISTNFHTHFKSLLETSTSELRNTLGLTEWG